MGRETHYTGLIAWFAYNPVAANLLMLTLLIVGFLTLATMRTEGFPEPDPNIVTVSTHFEGGSPENVEEGVVLKIEEALSGTEGVYKITSSVTNNTASIDIQANDGYQLSRLKDDVKVRVDSITTFPEQLESIVITETMEERHVVFVQVYGDSDHADLKQIAKQLRKRLLALSEVNKVTINGAKDFEISIELEEEKLRAFKLGFDEVAQAVQASSLNLSAGDLKTDSGRIYLESREQRYYGKEFENIIVRHSSEGGIVRLKDIARIHDGYTDQDVLSTFQGKPSINLDVELIGRDSVIDASHAVSELIKQINNENWLPKTIKLITWGDEADNVRDSLGILSKNALIGMLLVLCLLALFLDPRVAFWVAVGIPVSFAGAFIVMGPEFLDYSINDLSIFAFIIVLGIVVDDAIIIGESIFTHKKRDGGGTETAIRGALEVAAPATFGVLTTVAAFYPLTMFTGEFGGPFRIIAVVTIICLLFSIVESKLILPAHLANLKLEPVDNRKDAWARFRSGIENGLEKFINKVYQPMLRLATQYRYQSFCVFIAVFILTFSLISGGLVKVIFFGDENDSQIYATLKMDSGTSSNKTHQIIQYIEQRLHETGEILQEQYSLERNPVLYSYVSSDLDEEATIIAQIEQGSERPFYSQDLLDIWDEQVGNVIGIKELSYYIDYEGDQDLSIEVSSSEHELLHDAMAMLTEKVSQFQGVSDIRSNLYNYTPELTFRLKPEADLLGLSNRDVISQVRDAVFGLEAQRVQRQDEDIRVKVRYPQSERDDISDLAQIRIRTNQGGTVPLSQIIDISHKNTLSEIIRIDGKRVLTLSAQLNEDIISPSDLLDVLEEKIFHEIKRTYPGVDIVLAGESAAESEATTELETSFILGLLLIYALLAIPLKSYIDPFIIMLAIPFGVVGAILGHWIIGIPLSLLSFFGVLALSGVVVNDSLILVARYKQIKGQSLAYQDAVVQAGMSRFRAVLLTSITTFVGLFPLIMEKSEQAQNIIPMAVSLSFGILFATVITLLIVPVLLGIQQDVLELFRKSSIRKNDIEIA